MLTVRDITVRDLGHDELDAALDVRTRSFGAALAGSPTYLLEHF